MYIKTGKFDKEISRIISSAFDVRTDSDYNDFFIISKDSVINQINEARKVVETIKAFLNF